MASRNQFIAVYHHNRPILFIIIILVIIIIITTRSRKDSVQAGTFWIRYVFGKYIFWKYSGSVTDRGGAGINKNVICTSLNSEQGSQLTF